MLQEKLYSLNEPLGLIEVNMMDIQVFFVSYLIFGAMVGSFLNVLIYRLPIMLANLSSRSE
ncbi:prepilin peptidase, partial [Yersinia pestis]